MTAAPELLRPLLDGSPLTHFIYGVPTRQVLYLSPAYERLFPGHARGNIGAELPQLLRGLLPDDLACARRCFAELVAGHPPDDLLLRLQPHPTQPLRWLAVHAWPATAPDGQALICGTLQDVTLEQEYLRRADKCLAERNNTLVTLSHDLAGPFALLQQLAGYLEEKTQPLHDPQVQKLIGVMRDTCRESMGLIRDFVDGEFMDSAEAELQPTRVDLAGALAQAVATYQQAEHPGTRQFEFHSSHPSVYVEVDSDRFLQVLDHLVSNAIKFTADGGRIAVALHQHPDHVLMSVADDGIGIPAPMQPVLFDRFTAARRPGLRGEKTTGLGLSLVRTLVQLHGGSIWVESEEYRGSTFYIRLPVGAGESG